MFKPNMSEAPFFNDVAKGPETANALWITTEDGVRLRTVHWSSQPESKGTIFIFQGRSENLEKYGLLANEFESLGFDLFGVDWRGQGLSDRLHDDRVMGHIDSYSQYQKDVSAFVVAAEKLDLPKPWFMLAHSMGACIGLRALLNGVTPFSSCAFVAPMWGLNMPVWKRLIAWPLARASLFFNGGRVYAPGSGSECYVVQTPFSKNELTSDDFMYRYYISITEDLPEQRIAGASFGWVYHTMYENWELKREIPPNIPCLVVYGSDDRLVSHSAIVSIMARWPRSMTLKIAGARHDVLYEALDIRSNAIRDISTHFLKNKQ
jgi:lysophospholipase